MKSLLLFISILLCLFEMDAQKLEYIKSEGEIPAEFRTASADKYNSKIEELGLKKRSNVKSRKEVKNTKQFYLESSFSIDDLLQSGHILFNDKASNYLNEVLHSLPLSDDLKKSNPRVYLLNSNVVNAFATIQGIIFISVGLLANIENEAQLAFILSHELAHVEHKHSLDKFLKSKEISSNDYKRNLSRVELNSNIFNEAMYSQNLEKEADLEGLEMFLKSDYSTATISDVFTVLHYSYLPFENKPFPKSFFEKENYALPNYYWDIELPGILRMDEASVNEERTHPSAIDRMAYIDENLNSTSTPDKSNFLIGEDRFHEIKKLMRFQLPMLALESGYYARALYNSFLLLEEYPNDKELKKNIAKSLYYQTKFNWVNTYSSSAEEDMIYENNYFLDSEGEAQRIGVLFTEMEQAELNVFALKYNYELLQEYPNDDDLNWMVPDLFIELNHHFENLDKFKNTNFKIAEPEAQIFDSLVINNADSTLSRKDQIISINKEQVGDEEEEAYWLHSFSGYLDSKEFQDYFKEAKKEADHREAMFKSKDKWKEKRKLDKEHLRIGKSLDINKVVVVNPFYLKVDNRKDNEVLYIRSEQGQAKLRKYIKEAAQKSNLKVEMMDLPDLSSSQVEKFNDITSIGKYVSQQFEFDELSLTAGIRQEEINKIADKYNTDYFLYTGVISVREEENAGIKLLYGMLLYPLLPFIIYDILTPDFSMIHYAVLFDVKTGKRSILGMNYFDVNDSKFLIKAHTYDVFNQINKKRKK